MRKFIVLFLLLLLLHTKDPKIFSKPIDKVTPNDKPLLKTPDNDVGPPVLPPIESEPRLALIELKDNMKRLADLFNGIKPYMPQEVHPPIDRLCNVTTLIQDLYNLLAMDFTPMPNPEPAAVSLTPYQRQQGILNELKKYVGPKEQKTIDIMLKLNETLNQFMELMKTSSINTARAAQPIEKTLDKEKIWKIIEIIKPLLDQNKQKEFDKLVNKLKLFDAINSMDLASTENMSKEEQMQAMLNVIKPMLNKEQQDSLDKFMKIAEMMSKSSAFNMVSNDEGNTDDEVNEEASNI